MYNELIKDRITWCNNKNHTVNVKRIVDDPQLIDDIFAVTAFFSIYVSVNERIFCIMNDITTLPRCKFCGNKKSFRQYRGYRETCGSKSCGSKLRYFRINQKSHS